MWLQHAASSRFPQPGFYKSISTINSAPPARFLSDGAFYFCSHSGFIPPSSDSDNREAVGRSSMFRVTRLTPGPGMPLSLTRHMKPVRPIITVARGGASCGRASPGSVSPPVILCWAQMLDNMASKVCDLFRARIILVIVFISSLLTTWGPSCMLISRVCL